MTVLNILILSAGAFFGITQWRKMNKKLPDDGRPEPEKKFPGAEPTRGRS